MLVKPILLPLLIIAPVLAAPKNVVISPALSAAFKSLRHSTHQRPGNGHNFHLSHHNKLPKGFPKYKSTLPHSFYKLQQLQKYLRHNQGLKSPKFNKRPTHLPKNKFSGHLKYHMGRTGTYARARSPGIVSMSSTLGVGARIGGSISPQVYRRDTIPSPVTPKSPSLPTTPLSPTSPHFALHKSIRQRKSQRPLHKHTLSEAIQLNKLLVEAEQLVNGLEGQLNKPSTHFKELENRKRVQRFRKYRTSHKVIGARPAAAKVF